MIHFFIILILWSLPLLSIVLGIENKNDRFFADARKKKQRILLVTNQSGVAHYGERSLDVLIAQGLNVCFVAAPEHGLEGVVPAGADVACAKDRSTGIPVLSLYKGGRGQLIDPVTLNAIDCICFDIQECGMRHYTFISTLYKIMQMAGEHHKKVVVFDRPNLLGPVVAGPLVEPALISFISIAPIPVRYGLTIGELARYFNYYHADNKVDLHVVPMRGYNAQSLKAYTLTKPLSPNIQTLQACYGYSFLGILGEIRPFDVGIGTGDAFTILMVPEAIPVSAGQWQDLQQILHKKGVHATLDRYYSERKKMMMHGLRLSIAAIEKVSSVALIIDVVRWAQSCMVPLQFSAEFDKAAGVAQFRQVLCSNDAVATELLSNTVSNGITEYIKKAQVISLYPSMRLRPIS